MSLTQLSNSLYISPFSVAIRDTIWLIPTVQSIHIAAVAVVMGSALVADLRLAGVLATDVSPRSVLRHHMPWMWSAIGMLVATGLVMVVGEPNRVLGNWIFWMKMGFVLTVFTLTMLFRYPLLQPDFQLEHASWRALVKPMAWLSLAMWIAVIFCGRWIAYAI